jgi:hypothetical protein
MLSSPGAIGAGVGKTTREDHRNWADRSDIEDTRMPPMEIMASAPFSTSTAIPA